jgi:hypothetical protein
LLPIDVDYGHSDIVTDPDRLTYPACENEHGSLPAVVSFAPIIAASTAVMVTPQAAHLGPLQTLDTSLHDPPCSIGQSAGAKVVNLHALSTFRNDRGGVEMHIDLRQDGIEHRER